MKNGQKHKTRMITISVPVDDNLADFITWMNTLPGIKTDACCEGTYLEKVQTATTYASGVSTDGYILFHCEDNKSLIPIYEAIEAASIDPEKDLGTLDIDIEYEWEVYQTTDPRFQIKWRSKKEGIIEAFLKNLKDGIGKEKKLSVEVR